MFYSRHRFCNLPTEIQVTALCAMTAAELIDFRCCSVACNAVYMANESAIVRGVLKNVYYHTASTLYGTASATGPLQFECLKCIARRCSIVEMLATSIAEHHVGQGLATTIKMGENLRPYLLAIGHFFEEYRIGLPKFPRRYLTFTLAKFEGAILKANYNEETVRRMCLTYKILNQILDQKFIGGKPTIQDQLPYRTPWKPSPLAPVDMYIFGGLEMVMDIVTHSRLTDRLKYAASHFSKTTPAPMPVVGGNSLAVALPPSVLGRRLSLNKSALICELFPHPGPLLVSRLEYCGFSRVEPAEELDMDRDFLEYLKSYDGEEPQLVR